MHSAGAAHALTWLSVLLVPYTDAVRQQTVGAAHGLSCASVHRCEPEHVCGTCVALQRVE
jgi:hypothetical protein